MANIFEIPNFVESKTKMGLIKEMTRVNVQANAKHKFLVMKDGDGWCAWYERDITDSVMNQLGSELEKIKPSKEVK